MILSILLCGLPSSGKFEIVMYDVITNWIKSNLFHADLKYSVKAIFLSSLVYLGHTFNWVASIPS